VNVPKRLVEEWLASGSAVVDEESGVIALARHVDAYDQRFGLMPERVSAGGDPYWLIIDG